MKTTDSTRLEGLLSRRYMLQFFTRAIIFTLVLAALVLGAYILASTRVWYPEDPLYQVLNFVQENLAWFFFGCWVVGILIILFFQWQRISRGVISLSVAIRQIAAGEEAAIQLPSEMEEVAQLLRQVQMESLRNSQLAAEAEQRKNDLVVYLAHDLKTPLTSVLGYLTLLRDEADISPELRQRYLDIATTKAQKLEDLINEFFEITRFSLKGLVLEPTHLNFSRMAEQITDEFRPGLAGKNLRFALHIQPDIEILADAGKLQRVVDNLLRNAVSYSFPGTEITVGVWLEGPWVRLFVQNHGNTIPPHKLAHVFEQFYRVDDARGGEEGGSGLGLAIAHEIVELHGGTITVVSENEQIEFVVNLPWQKPGLAPAPVFTAKPVPADPPGPAALPPVQ